MKPNSNKEYTYLCKDGVWRYCNKVAINHMTEMSDKSKGKFNLTFKKVQYEK